jgi:hypothetical protein
MSRPAPNTRFPGQKDAGDHARSGAPWTCPHRILRIMAAARRTPPKPPTHVARRRAHALATATALAGGLAGLVAGAACVAWAPAVGRVARDGSAPERASRSNAAARSHPGAVDGVARVLAPARESGIPARYGQGGEDDAP